MYFLSKQLNSEGFSSFLDPIDFHCIFHNLLLCSAEVKRVWNNIRIFILYPFKRSFELTCLGQLRFLKWSTSLSSEFG